MLVYRIEKLHVGDWEPYGPFSDQSEGVTFKEVCKNPWNDYIGYMEITCPDTGKIYTQYVSESSHIDPLDDFTQRGVESEILLSLLRYGVECREIFLHWFNETFMRILDRQGYYIATYEAQNVYMSKSGTQVAWRPEFAYIVDRCSISDWLDSRDVLPRFQNVDVRRRRRHAGGF